MTKPASAEAPSTTPRVGNVTAEIIKHVASSALTPAHARAMRLRMAEDAELQAINRPVLKTIAIPYFDLDGLPINFTRYRCLEDTRNVWGKFVTGQKTTRYFQAAGTGLHAYFPPFVDWQKVALDVTQTLLITEGEKKAASATVHGFPCVGLGGVDCFASKKDDTLLLPELQEGIRWEGRDVVIIFDSDAATNQNVLAASIRLGRRLFALQAKVRIASLPPWKDADGNLQKQGVDDLIVHAGEEAAQALAEVIKEASAELFEREIALYDFNRRFCYIRDMDRVIVREDGAILQPEPFIKRAYVSETHYEYRIKETIKDGKTCIPVKTSTADEWMKWEGRLTKKTLDFEPTGGELTERGYNLWRGWPVAPVEGDVKLWKELLGYLFGESPEQDRLWFERWLAAPFRWPGIKLKTATLLWSRAEGTGKSTVLEAMRAVYGSLYCPMNDSAVDLTYTDWLVNKLFVGVDDISAKTRDDHAAKWKNLITANRLTIQKKYTPSFEVTSHVNFIMTSNEPNALRLSPKDRRYFVHKVPEWGNQKIREKFFDAFYKWLHSPEGPPALLHHLATLSMGDFAPDANALMTSSKLDMQDLSLGPLEHWLENLKDAPDSVLQIGSAIQRGELWSSDDLVALYNARSDRKSDISRVTMGMALTAAGVPCAYKGNQVRLSNKTRVRLFVVRNAEKWTSDEVSNADIRDHYESTRCSK